MLILFCTLGLSQLKFSEDISDFLPVDKGYSTVNSFTSQASGNSRLIIFFRTKDSVFNTNEIAECMDKYVKNLKINDKDSLFKSLTSSYDDSKIFLISEFIQKNIPLFLTQKDYLHADSLLNFQHVEAAISADKKILSSPLPTYVKSAVKNDPLGLFIHKLNNLKDLRPTDCYSIINGHIFEQEKKRGIIFFDSPTNMSESNINAQIIDNLQLNIKTVALEYPNIEISIFGAPVIAVCNSRQIKHDTILTTLLSIILIVLILWFSIRNLKNLIWMTLTLIFGFLISGAAAWLFLGKISLIALGISAVFTGIAINYPLHFITHLYHCENIRQNMYEVISPLVTGNITTVAAFFSLMFAGSNALRDLGFIGGILLIASILFTLIFLPHFIENSTKKSHKKTFRGIDFSFDFLCKKWVVIPIIIITPILIYFGCKTEFDSDLHNINYMTDDLKQEAEHTFGLLNSDSLTSVFVTATADDIESALQKYEQTEKITDSLQALGLITKVSGIADFLPSMSRQKERIDSWNLFLSTRRDTIQQLFLNGLKSGKLKENIFEPFNELINKDFTPIQFSDFSPLMDNALKNYVHISKNSAAIVTILKVKPQNVQKVEEIFNTLNVIVYDEKLINQSFANILNENFNYVLFAAGLIVFVFLTISYGRIELSIISFIPLTISWFWILGIMYFFDLKFNIVNIILATFIFGQGDDYAVFMTEGLMYEYARGKRVLKSFKNSVAISALIMFVGIGSLILSKHPAMSSLGVIVVIGMFSVVVSSFVFPPLLFGLLTKNKDEKLRQSPYTLRQIIFSGVYFIVFITACYILYIKTLFINKKMSSKKKLHQTMQRIAKMTHHIPGVKFTIENPNNNSFNKPSVLIANHSSSFDVLCMMTLNPNLLFVTNDSQQRNPFYGRIIRHADFYPISLGYGVLKEKLKPFVDAGFSIVVFPEGTRSTDNKIHRFHQGAFFLAQSLGLPITPVLIHGAGHVYPKNALFLQSGAISIRIEKTIEQNHKELFKENILETSRNFRHYFMTLYQNFSNKKEDFDYCKNIVISNYIYKGSEIAKAIKKGLDNYSQKLKNTNFSDKAIFKNCGYGEVPFLYALLNPNTEVFAEDDNEHIEVAKNCKDLPKNITFNISQN